jgi:hypothetical protein
VSDYPVTENEFRKHLLLRLGQSQNYRVWAQNCGKIMIPQAKGPDRAFNAGPPVGAADISGIVAPEGWRIEYELKGPRTRVTDAQLNWEQRMLDLGAVYVRYRIDASRGLNENLDRAAYALDEAIEVRRRGTIGVRNCACPSCEIVKQARV